MEHFGLFSIRCPIEPFSTKNTGLPTGNDIADIIAYNLALAFQEALVISIVNALTDYYNTLSQTPINSTVINGVELQVNGLSILV